MEQSYTDKCCFFSLYFYKYKFMLKNNAWTALQDMTHNMTVSPLKTTKAIGNTSQVIRGGLTLLTTEEINTAL